MGVSVYDPLAIAPAAIEGVMGQPEFDTAVSSRCSGTVPGRSLSWFPAMKVTRPFSRARVLPAGRALGPYRRSPRKKTVSFRLTVLFQFPIRTRSTQCVEEMASCNT